MYADWTSEFDLDYEEKGLLMLFNTAKQGKKEEGLMRMAQRLGVEAELLDRSGLRELEPEMALDVEGGLYFPGDAHLYPNVLLKGLVRRLRDMGVNFLCGHAVKGLEMREGKVVGLECEVGEQDSRQEVVNVDQVLLASGSWTAGLLKGIGIRLLLQDGKGYSLTLKAPGLRPRIPTILAEAKVAITPMGNDLRIGGTLELSGLSGKVNASRVQGILDSIPRYYRNLGVPELAQAEIWQGYRPCSPDGLPYIGRPAGVENLAVASGHGMMGLSLGPATGLLVKQLLSGEEPFLNLLPYRPDRF